MATRALTILTGASRGMGAAMVDQLLLSDALLLTISRHPRRAIEGKAVETGAVLEQWAI